MDRSSTSDEQDALILIERASKATGGAMGPVIEFAFQMPVPGMADD